MTKTIARLWNGDLEPARSLGKNDPEARHLEVLMLRSFEKLEESLNEKSKEILKKYSDCTDEYITVMTEQAFCKGFCLGAKITAEALTGGDDAM